MDNTANSEPIKDKNRNESGQFVKGNNANPGGRNGKYTIKCLIDALENRFTPKEGGFWEYVARRANTNDAVLMAILKKILPDKIQGEGFDNSTKIIILERKNKEADAESSSKILNGRLSG